MPEPSAPARKWTRPEYDRLVEAEFFGPEDRIELLGGHMVVKEPQHSPHATSIRLVQRTLAAAFGPGWDVREQMPVALYARAGIADYWIVNIPSRRVEVYRDAEPDATTPFGWRYGRSITLGPDERVAPRAAPQASILIADLLP